MYMYICIYIIYIIYLDGNHWVWGYYHTIGVMYLCKVCVRTLHLVWECYFDSVCVLVACVYVFPVLRCSTPHLA